MSVSKNIVSPAGSTALEVEVVEPAHVDLTLPQLEVLVDKHFSAFQTLGRRTVEEAWQAGNYLRQAKALVNHGGWLDWLDERGVANQTANRLMQLSKLDIPQVGEFDSVQAALKQIAAPSDHDKNASGFFEWYTPPEIIEAARTAMGGIDLDPASSDVAQETVKAKRYFTIEDDGLSKQWKGRTWLNPPYSTELLGKFVEKVLTSKGPTCVLVNNTTETKSGQALLEQADAACFFNGRVRFLGPKESTSPLQGQMLVGLRVNAEAFRASFSPMGAILCG